jgi:predicted deacylase
VPVVNPYGLIQHSRYLPDRRDLNRSFPGMQKGSLASRVAKIFIDEIAAVAPSLRLVSPNHGARRGSQVSFAFAHGFEAMQALISRGVIARELDSGQLISLPLTAQFMSGAVGLTMKREMTERPEIVHLTEMLHEAARIRETST